MASQLKLSPSLTIPAASTTLYPFSLKLTDRRDEPLLTPGRACYVRLVDEDEVKVTGLLYDTSGVILSASSSDAFPSSAGWYALTTTTIGLFEGNIAVASNATTGVYELQSGWIQFGAARQDRAQTAFAAAGSLTAVTDVLGTPTGASLSEDISVIKALVGESMGNGSLAADIGAPVVSLAADIDTMASKIGTPADTVSADIAAVLYQTQVTNNYIPNIANAVYLCTGTLALGPHSTTVVKSLNIPESGIDYTGMRLLIRRTSDGNAEVRTISAQSFTPPRSMTVSASYQFTPQDGDFFAVLAP